MSKWRFLCVLSTVISIQAAVVGAEALDFGSKTVLSWGGFQQELLKGTAPLGAETAFRNLVPVDEGEDKALLKIAAYQRAGSDFIIGSNVEAGPTLPGAAGLQGMELNAFAGAPGGKFALAATGSLSTTFQLDGAPDSVANAVLGGDIEYRGSLGVQGNRVTAAFAIQVKIVDSAGNTVAATEVVSESVTNANKFISLDLEAALDDNVLDLADTVPYSIPFQMKAGESYKAVLSAKCLTSSFRETNSAICVFRYEGGNLDNTGGIGLGAGGRIGERGFVLPSKSTLHIGSDAAAAIAGLDDDLAVHDKNIDDDLIAHDKNIGDGLVAHDMHIDQDLIAHDMNIDDDLRRHNEAIGGALVNHDEFIGRKIDGHQTQLDTRVEEILAALRDLAAKLDNLENGVGQNQQDIVDVIRLLHTPQGRRRSNVEACGGAPCRWSDWGWAP